MTVISLLICLGNILSFMLDFQGTDPIPLLCLMCLSTVNLLCVSLWMSGQCGMAIILLCCLVLWLKQAPLNSSALWGVHENSITSTERGKLCVLICFFQFSLLEWMEFVIILYRSLLFWTLNFFFPWKPSSGPWRSPFKGFAFVKVFNLGYRFVCE